MRFFLFIFFAVVLFSGNAALAQGPGFIYGQDALSIDLDPAFPGPENPFTASANDYSLPVQGAGIRWFVDGELVVEARNKRDLKLVSKPVGETTTIELVIDLAGGGTISAKRVIAPMYLDVIVEPQTRTPAFFKGRPLPSIGSTVNATALINGDPTKASSYIYTWQLNGETLEGGAVRGQNVISFPMPRGNNAVLSLEVRTPDGDTLARRTIGLTSVYPSVQFYEVSTLYGLSKRALGDSTPLTGTTLVVRAEPYNLDLDTFNDPDVAEWRINNKISPNQSSNPYEITLASSGVGGKTKIAFHVRNTIQVLQGARAEFLVTF